MESITFLVQGSASEPYKVTFRKNADNLTALCDCPAGIYGQYCKHRINILAGSTKDIVSSNTSDVKTVSSWLPGTDIETAIKDVQEAEHQFNIAKKIFQTLKKNWHNQ